MPTRKNTAISLGLQLSFFDEQTIDKRPLPELIALGGSDWAAFPLAYADVESVRYYAIQDWLRGVAFAENPSRYWTDMKKRMDKAGIQIYASCVSLNYKATDGKTYKRDHATDETLYAITQRMDATTGIRDHILAYLARAGVKLDEVRRDSNKVADLVGAGSAIDAGIAKYKEDGKDALWIQARYMGKINRHSFTDAINAALSTPSDKVYKEATNTVYFGLWERTATQLRADLGIGAKDNLRDHFPQLALAYTSIAEMLISEELGDAHELTWEQALRIIKQVARVIREQIDMINQIKGTDMMTGRTLIGKGK